MAQGDPSDCTVHHGSGNLLVVAPHAALSASEAPRRRANDFHTAAVACAIAARVGGSCIVNHSLDRNRLDLNRRSAVEQRAPWFAALLRDALAVILARHATAWVLFVHGWNIVQARCDIGVGTHLADVRAAASCAPNLTASATWLETRVEALRRACRSLGIRATYGERWPGAHPNNLLQVFRRTPRTGLGGPLAEVARWAASGRAEAVQLELGAPLRWPGELRDAFVGACARVLDGPEPGASGVSDPTDAIQPSRGGGAPGRIGLQFFDPAAGPRGLGILAGIAHLPDGDTGARLLLFLGASRVGVFIGHERGHGALAVEGLRIQTEGHGGLFFDGHMLLAEDGSRYFADERSQAESRLVRLRIGLSFEALGRTGYGRVAGEVRLGGERVPVDAFAFTRPLLLGFRQEPRMTRACAAFGARGGLVADTASESLRVLPGWRDPLPPAAVVGEPATGSFAFEIAGAGRMDCHPEGRIRLWRPLPSGGTIPVLIGPARFTRAGDGEGTGFFEHTAPPVA